MKDSTSFEPRKRRSTPYQCVDGRYYTPDNIDLDLTPPRRLERELTIAKPSEIYRMERWFQDGMNQIYEDMPFAAPPPKDNLRILNEYHCYTHARGFIAADNDRTYRILCRKYPAARQFPSYGHILYAMRYGNAPCKTYKIGEEPND